MADKPDTVTVKALEDHTYNGKAYEAGDTYEIAADLVDSIVAQRKAAPVDSGEGPVKPPRATGTTAVEPITRKK